MGRAALNGIRNPSWFDPACHRSFYNQHLVAALKFAVARPHEAVTFLSYACSGAAVFNGLLTSQPQPPGYRDDPEWRLAGRPGGTPCCGPLSA
uniref:Uncharacterized protein n=1 Tax=Phenylobacterium glaciei TaxID=2803784 RepID=A0A974P143_9CAUL|nr:hypothetical protein JKL49_19665 [Phenylobacterium glaciei]